RLDDKPTGSALKGAVAGGGIDGTGAGGPV
ncbi:unnamed protein product, partial [marine sediment metagenome]